MTEVLEQLNKMTREERLRIAHWLLDGIAHGEVVKPVKDDNGAQEVYEYLMGQGGWLPKDYRFDREEANARCSLLLAAAEAERCDEILTEDLNDGQFYCSIKAVNPFKQEVKGNKK